MRDSFASLASTREPTRSPQHGMVVHSHNDYFVGAAAAGGNQEKCWRNCAYFYEGK